MKFQRRQGILLPATSQVPTMISFFMWNDSIIQNIKQQLNIISYIIQQQINEAGPAWREMYMIYIIDKCEDKHKFWKANCQLGLNIF